MAGIFQEYFISAKYFVLLYLLTFEFELLGGLFRASTG